MLVNQVWFQLKTGSPDLQACGPPTLDRVPLILEHVALTLRHVALDLGLGTPDVGAGGPDLEACGPPILDWVPVTLEQVALTWKACSSLQNQMWAGWGGGAIVTQGLGMAALCWAECREVGSQLQDQVNGGCKHGWGR